MQLPLEFKHKSIKSLANFIVGDNDLLLKSLNDFLPSSQTLFYIWGYEKSGKSHLLQAIHTKLQAENQSSSVFPASVLNDREQIQLVQMFDYLLIDDIDQLIGNKSSEENLFQWINEAKQNHKKIILSCSQASQNLQCQLPDLRSRLQSGQQHRIKPLNRQDLLTVFQKEAKSRGHSLDQKTLEYVEKNCPMNLPFLMGLLHQLDCMTLIKKQTVTVPLIRQILNSNLVNQE